MREKLNMPFWQQQSSEEISLAQVSQNGVKMPPGALLLMQPVGTLVKGMPKPTAPQQKHAQPVASGDTGRWTAPRDTLTPLRRSPPPRPGEWNVHRVALAPLGISPLLPKTPAQPYESCSSDKVQVPVPRPVSQTQARNLG